MVILETVGSMLGTTKQKSNNNNNNNKPTLRSSPSEMSHLKMLLPLQDLLEPESAVLENQKHKMYSIHKTITSHSLKTK